MVAVIRCPAECKLGHITCTDYQATYTYKGENESGELKAAVTEIDNSPANKISEVWSENAKSSKTNKSVTAQLRFDKLITKAEWKNQSGYLPEIYKLDNQVTISYSENAPTMTLVCTAVNGQVCEITLNEVHTWHSL